MIQPFVPKIQLIMQFFHILRSLFNGNERVDFSALAQNGRPKVFRPSTAFLGSGIWPPRLSRSSVSRGRNENRIRAMNQERSRINLLNQFRLTKAVRIDETRANYWRECRPSHLAP
jgi:hypothetical protein